MTIETQPIWARTIADFIQTEGLSDMASADEIVGMVLDQTLYWELPLDKGRRLMLVRLSSPVTVREEVLLGNILFNDFLNKSVIHAINEARLGHVLPITNDLENAYFLIVTSADLTTVSQTVRDYVTEHLPDLFFADDDPERGIHGSFEDMFTFLRSDYEPFPVFAIPQVYRLELERRVRSVLKRLLEEAPLTVVRERGKVRRFYPSLQLRTIQAAMAFFYGQDGNETQSHPELMARCVERYGILDRSDVAVAMRLEEPQGGKSLKARIKDAIGAANRPVQFEENRLHLLLAQMLDAFTRSIDMEGTHSPWLMGSIQNKGKLLNLNREQYVNVLLSRVLFGPQFLGRLDSLAEESSVACRTCGAHPATVDEKDVMLGKSGQFHNQTVQQAKGDIRRICISCSLYCYLATKLLGFTSDQLKGTTVPHQSNLIFHYGRHTPEGAEALGQQIGIVRLVLHKVQEARRAVFEANKKVKDEEQKQRFGTADEERVMLQELQAKLSAGELSPEEMTRLQGILLRMARQASQAREVIEGVGSAHVVDIGLGDQRLIVFALENLYDERNLAQKTFSRSRLPVFALLAFLQDICGCDGPYYFQALPRVDVEASSPGYFYIRRQRIEAAQYRRQYEAISAFAKHVVPGFDLKAFKKRIKLAEELADHPLETFSQVLRRSTCIRGEKDSPYRLFTGEQDQPRWDRDLNIFESWAYLKALNTLRELEEVMHELE